MKRTFMALTLLAAGLSLSGCYGDGYGYGDGVYSAGAYPYGYGGYYEGYYRPGYYGGYGYRPGPNYRSSPHTGWHDGRRGGNWRGDFGNRGGHGSGQVAPAPGAVVNGGGHMGWGGRANGGNFGGGNRGGGNGGHRR